MNPDPNMAAIGCAALQEEEDDSLPLTNASG